MEHKLLVGIDCSDCCNRGLDYATARARASNSRLVLIHVIEWSPYTFNTPMENEVRHKRREEELERARAEIIDPLVARLREQGLRVEGIIRHGSPAETISQVATEIGATNIVIGRRGLSRFRSHVFGSVPGKLVQIADQPVTVVP